MEQGLNAHIVIDCQYCKSRLLYPTEDFDVANKLHKQHEIHCHAFLTGLMKYSRANPASGEEE